MSAFAVGKSVIQIETELTESIKTQFIKLRSKMVLVLMPHCAVSWSV
jgi:hypothetical protein